MKLYFSFIISLIVLLNIGPVTATKWVCGYYPGYQRNLYPAEEINFENLTHLIVGRIEPRADGTLTKHFDIDDVNGPAMARDLAIRAHNAGKFALLMIGGAGCTTWSEAASSAIRETFVANLIAAMKDYGFDGLDIDWEPIAKIDYPNLKALSEELKAAEPGMILTIPLPWVRSTGSPVDTFFSDIASIFDQVNLMTYSMAGNWSGWKSWHTSALSGEAPNTPSSVKTTVQKYLDAGIPAQKLGIGFGFYGTCWSGVTGPGQEGGTILAGDNVMNYTNIIKYYYAETAKVWDDEAQVPYLSFDTATGPQGCTFVSYDDPESIKLKGEYVHEMGLGGAIIWTINEGYIAENPVGNRNPPLEAVGKSILDTNTGTIDKKKSKHFNTEKPVLNVYDNRIILTFPIKADISISLFTINGKMVDLLYKGRSAPGINTFLITEGNVSTGVYCIKADINSHNLTKLFFRK